MFGWINGLFESSISLPVLLDELPIGIMVLNRERRIIFLNRVVEVLTGFNRDEVWGVPCCYVVRSNFCHHDCLIDQVEKKSGPSAFEGNIINRDHQKIDVQLTGAPLKDTENNIVGFLETVLEIRSAQTINGDILKPDSFERFIGRSPKIQELFKIIPAVAQTASSVLITGETGTGKDLTAAIIHKASDRTNSPFIKINCGALPETLLESELFGHKKGAFPGAVSDKPGRLRLALDGTLYFTEISDLPYKLQTKLLAFLNDGMVYPKGSTKGFQADVRIIASTHGNIEQMVKAGRFRQDLFFRLNAVRLNLPPLREREEDIGLLLEHFVKFFSTSLNKRIKGFSQETKRLLLNYDYPGNVRELRNIVGYASNICRSELIEVEHLPAYLHETREVVHDRKPSANPDNPTQEGEKHKETSGVNWTAIERQLIIDTLIKANGHRGKAAKMLGWGRSTLWRKMKQYHIDS